MKWIPKEWKENPGKYSVQIQKIQIQMVNHICSEWIPLENIRFKFKSFDFKWSTLYVRNRFRWKIFGSNSKVLISNG